MPIIDTKTRAKNIVFPVQATVNVQEIYSPQPWGDGTVSARALVKSLTIRAAIKSLDEIDVPDFEFPGSQADRFIKNRDNTWTKARYQFDLCKKVEGGEWREEVSLSLQNHKSTPYTSQHLLRHITQGIAMGVGEGTRIGIRFVDVGYGIPSPDDRITVFGEVHEECQVQSSRLFTCEPRQWNIGGSKTTIDTANTTRKQILLINSGDTNVWVSRSDNAQVGVGLLIAPNGTLTVNSYSGVVTAIAEGASVLVGEICY